MAQLGGFLSATAIDRGCPVLLAEGALETKGRVPRIWLHEMPSMDRASVLKPKILVADDDRTTRFAISSMLRKAGYAVTAVKDGAEALRNIQRNPFDLAFLDI